MTTKKTLIKENISLIDKNWFKTGGAARYFAEPTTVTEFQQALSWAHDNNQAVFVLGCGANIVISDTGFPGLVIRPALQSVEINDINGSSVTVTAGAGCTINDLITTCLEHNITGLEEFSGIPATVGGATYGNLHYFDHNLGQFLTLAHIIEKTTGATHTVDADWCQFGYDSSRLCKKDYYITHATFTLTRATDVQTAYAQGRRDEIIRHRARRYPTHNTCGCFFRNFHDHEITQENNGKKILHVGYYLDKLGVKGNLKKGDASVSWQHANMLVNNGTATSDDIIQLARTLQQMTLDHFGILPQPECELIGFNSYPLLQQ